MSIRPTNSKVQLRSIQAGRGFAALLVVALHSSVYFNLDKRYWNRPDLFTLLRGGQMGVEYFFVLSGAVIFLAHWNDLGRPRAILTYLKKRFRRIYPIYWIILSVVVLEYMLRPGLGASYQTNPFVVLSGYLLVHIRSLEVNLPVAWTLFHEVLFYLVFMTLLIRRTIGYVVLVIWSALSLSMAFYPASAYLRDYLFAPIHLLFPLGMLIGWLLQRRLLKASWITFVMGLLTFGLVYYLSSLGSMEPHALEWAAGIGSALMILGAAGLELRGTLAVPKPLQFLGDASYSIYLVHYPFLMFFAPIAYRASLHAAAPPILTLTVMIVCATLAGCLLHSLVEKPMLNYFGRAAKPRSSKDVA